MIIFFFLWHVNQSFLYFLLYREHQHFVLLCLKLLCTHLQLALAGGLASTVLGNQARPLRHLLFRLMDTNTPSSVQKVCVDIGYNLCFVLCCTVNPPRETWDWPSLNEKRWGFGCCEQPIPPQRSIFMFPTIPYSSSLMQWRQCVIQRSQLIIVCVTSLRLRVYPCDQGWISVSKRKYCACHLSTLIELNE